MSSASVQDDASPSHVMPQQVEGNEEEARPKDFENSRKAKEAERQRR